SYFKPHFREYLRSNAGAEQIKGNGSAGPSQIKGNGRGGPEPLGTVGGKPEPATSYPLGPRGAIGNPCPAAVVGTYGTFDTDFDQLVTKFSARLEAQTGQNLSSIHIY